MPKRRVLYRPGGYYHIYNRGANRTSICRNDDNFSYLLRLLKRYLSELDITMIAYCLLPNHYHWLVRQEDETSAGKLPQRVFNAYSSAFNKMTGHTGTLFEGRYKAIAVGTAPYLHHLCRYIHVNPVKHGLAIAPELWPYSNYLEWLGRRPGTLVDSAFIVNEFGSPARYEAYVQAYLNGQSTPPYGLEQYLESL